MAKFPGPSINRVIDSDPQIVRVPLDETGIAGRRSAQPKNIKNDMTIKHVGGKD